ncbi:uncharacterized protein MONOS_16911 [Monocercomonoides exilis]|uniref:uncharacterized protein n=1 Tax=Monocercomonoides exilis TaxID=2049356 RepID=UPI00355A3927|nr:hypothetical protein MONOS_16911 [Monocercomonoides exilis]
MLGNVSGGLAKATGQGASEAGYVLGLWLGRPCGLAWLYSTCTVFPQSEKVTEGGMLEGSWSFTGGARAPETKVTVCAQTVAARWAGCCWAPSGRVGSGYKAGWWESGWAGWLGGGVGGRAPETKVTVQRGTRTVQWAGSGLWAVGRTCWVGCALEIHYENGMPEKPALILKRENYTTPRLIAPQGQVSETSRCHRGSRCTLALHNGDMPMVLWGGHALLVQCGTHSAGGLWLGQGQWQKK